MGRSGVKAAYETGKGKVIVRAKTEIEEHKDGTSSIIVTELPYQVNKKMLVESIAELAKDKRIEGISDIDDHSSDRVGIRVEISVKRDANPQVVLNKLFKFTRLQDSFSINMLAIDNGKPKTMGLKEILANFISFQEEIVTRRTEFDLKKAEARMHILEGLRIALANIDEVINTIRNSYDDAKERLMQRFSMSDIQAQSVLDMRLAQLQKLNGEKIEDEYNELVARCDEYRLLLSDHDKLMEQIEKELIEIRDKYGDERLTSIEGAVDDIEDEDLIPNDESVITLTHFGYVKRLVSDTYKSQKRGGKGISALSTREEDFVEKLMVTHTHNYILFFTDRGRMYHLKGYQIPEAGRHAKGTAIVNLIPVEEGEKVTAMIPVSSFDEGNLTMATRNGVIKKTPLVQYGSLRKGGLNAITLDDGDELIDVRYTSGDDDIILGTHDGMSIKFNERDARPMGRTARGVRGIKLREGDYVVGMAIIEEGADLLCITENGYGKRTDFDEYRNQTRGGIGISTYKITEKTGKLAGIKTVRDDNDVMLITNEGVIIRMSCADISKFKRSTQGVTLMRFDEGVSVVSMSVGEHAEEEPDENESEEAPEIL